MAENLLERLADLDEDRMAHCLGRHSGTNLEFGDAKRVVRQGISYAILNNSGASHAFL